MLGAVENVCDEASFKNFAAVHDEYRVGSLFGDTEVVRYVEHSRAKLVGEGPQQLEHLRLHADVQGRGGLVREEQTWAVRDGHRNNHSLAHTPRELMRILAHAHIRALNSDTFK